MRLFLALIALFVLQTMPVFAAEATPTKSAPAINPLTRLETRTKEIMKDLTPEQVKQFSAIRTAHGALRGVDHVKASLERAVKSCIAKNPDLTEQMTAHFQDWKNAILPALRQSENRLEKLILLQDFTRPSTMRAYLKIFDDAVKFQNSQFAEVPVSDKRACKDMAENMDDSQKKLVRLMIKTLGLDQNPVDDKSVAPAGAKT